MRDEEAQTSTSTIDCKGLFGRGKYKLWALAAILLLAFWSMFTGSITLKLSAVNLKHSSDGLDSTIHPDLDILDVEEREKMVRQMWNVYTHSSTIRLPTFWRDAFAAAYQDLTSDAAAVHNAAVSEIANMSFRSRDIYEPPPPLQSTIRASKKEAQPRTQVGKTIRPQ
ncbi:Protein of unknown function (DUF1195) [Abeliophyllum distichum]|uniref:Sugar transporter n=1 Tax=Abeliophyllum distichum TaxID=126358 RepID=A0ABD1SC86_9LAMI